MAALYPSTEFTLTVQSTANDIPGDPTIANGAHFNKHDEEIKAVTDDLRAAIGQTVDTDIEGIAKSGFSGHSGTLPTSATTAVSSINVTTHCEVTWELLCWHQGTGTEELMRVTITALRVHGTTSTVSTSYGLLTTPGAINVVASVDRSGSLLRLMVQNLSATDAWNYRVRRRVFPLTAPA